MFNQPSVSPIHHQAALGTNISLSRTIFNALDLIRSHWPSLLTVSLIVNVIWFAIIGWPASVLVEQWKRLDGLEADDGLLVLGILAATFAVGLFFAPASAYAMAVVVRLCLRVARYGERDPIGVRNSLADLSVPIGVVLRISALLMGIATVLVMALFAGLILIVGLSLFIEPRRATLWGTFGVGSVMIAIVFLLQWLMWPVVFLIADERATLTTAVGGGIRLARQHRRLSLSLVTVYFVLATAGSLLLYVGQVLTTPIAMMGLAIGYLRMTGGQRFLRS